MSPTSGAAPEVAHRALVGVVVDHDHGHEIVAPLDGTPHLADVSVHDDTLVVTVERNHDRLVHRAVVPADPVPVTLAEQRLEIRDGHLDVSVILYPLRKRHDALVVLEVHPGDFLQGRDRPQ
ncbi:MAG: hypothetical protein M5U09_26000 [Gammaproteobacteria bacterium]|nr:hypothetical protein [Gammaproteobacteria bacterium]